MPVVVRAHAQTVVLTGVRPPFPFSAGSDPTWHAHFAHYADPSITSLPAGWGVPPIRHYRNKDELRHSLRSLFRSMGVQGHVRTFHLVLGDWALGGHAAPVVKQFFDGDIHAWQAADGGREWRVGQMPEWLNATVLGLERAGLTVKVHHHSEIFKDRTVDNEEAAMQYRSKALPNFNSCVGPLPSRRAGVRRPLLLVRPSAVC